MKLPQITTNALREAREELEFRLPQQILGALEHRGFYDQGKFLDNTFLERIMPLIDTYAETVRTKAYTAGSDDVIRKCVGELEAGILSVFEIQAIAEKSGKSSDIDFNIGGNAGSRRAIAILKGNLSDPLTTK